MRILLIVAPFGLVEYPNLATSLLKAEAREAGFDCDLIYGSLEFAKKIGFLEYWILYTVDPQLLIPERIFAKGLFREQIPEWDEYLRDVVAPYEASFGGLFRRPDGKSIASATLDKYEVLAEEFIEEFLARPDLADYDVIGFSNSYGQNVASLLLARGLKERYPETTIIFGGANCAGQMGRALARLFPWIDYVCDGDGDLSFPRFLEQLDAGEEIRVPGIYSRDQAIASHAANEPFVEFGGPQELVRDLDSLPLPDYSDYFAAFDFPGDRHAHTVAIPMETSRGCWWGQKHHCVFCGLNRSEMSYRHKSPERIDSELRSLVERYGERNIMMTDNIMTRRFPAEALPLIEKDRVHDCIFFEVKANLRRDELEKLARGGVRHLQPGLESLSTHVLQLMDKGVDVHQNLQLLKWAKEFGIAVSWNILCGFSGEEPEDYEAVAELIPHLHHLRPPLGFSVITVDRFSPMFQAPERFGITIEPVRGYRYVYPFADADLRELAYWFSHARPGLDSQTTLAPPPYAKRAHQAFQIWKKFHGRVDFSYCDRGGDRIQVRDTRAVSTASEVELGALESRVFASLDQKGSVDSVLRRVEASTGERPDRSAVEDVLARFRECNYLFEESDQMLVLANRRDDDDVASADRTNDEGLWGPKGIGTEIVTE